MHRKFLIFMIMVLLIMGLTAACSPNEGGSGASAEKPKVALLLTQRTNEGNFDIAGYKAFKAMTDKYEFEGSYAEMCEYDKAPETLREYASRGYELIIGNSGGYIAAIQEVAPEFPDVWFVCFAADDNGNLPNVACWTMDYTDFGFQTGIVAGLMTKTNKIGSVGAVTIDPLVKEEKGFEIGVKYVNPDAEVQNIWIGSFEDAAKAKEAALSHINWGADVLVHYADTAGLGVFAAAKENNIKAIGQFIDESSAAPEIIMTSGIVGFDEAYDEIGLYFKEKRIEPKVRKLTIANSMLYLAPLENMPEDVVAQVEQIIADIKSGKISVPQN